MKKYLRIILSPLVFIFVFCGMFIIPIGPLALIMRLGVKFGCWIMDSNDDTEWEFVFAWIYGPYLETKKFIDGGGKGWF